MRSIESVGRTVEEAIDEALKKLQVTRDQVQVEVIDEGAKGIFGLIGTKLARVRVSLKPVPQEKVVVAPPPRPTISDINNEATPVTAQPTEKASWGKEFLQQLLDKMGVEGEVNVAGVGDVISLSITGANAGLIIGHRGQTLDAIQYVTNLAASKAGLEGPKFVVDAENYRVRRQKTLEQLAERLAAKVISRRRKAILDPMSPQERRVIHLYLRDNPSVCTYSEGKEPNRRVIIDLKK